MNEWLHRFSRLRHDYGRSQWWWLPAKQAYIEREERQRYASSGPAEAKGSRKYPSKHRNINHIKTGKDATRNAQVVRVRDKLQKTKDSSETSIMAWKTLHPINVCELPCRPHVEPKELRTLRSIQQQAGVSDESTARVAS